MTLVDVQDLAKHYPAPRRGWRRQPDLLAVDSVSFAIDAGETLGLVGESGCGKTTVARTLLHLVPPSAGQVRIGDTDVTAVFREGRRDRVLAVRRAVQYVFQDPFLALNPRWTVGQALAEPLRVHALLPPAQWPGRVLQLLDLVGLEAAHAGRYPHELSGGQRQRVAIARALAVSPELVVADEPVSALDVSLQAQIIRLLLRLRDELGLTLVFISHDLALVHHLCDEVVVMQAGHIVERGTPASVLHAPQHAYTRLLIDAVPAGPRA